MNGWDITVDVGDIGILAQGIGALLLTIPVFLAIKDRREKNKLKSRRKFENIQPIRALQSQLEIIKKLETLKQVIQCNEVGIIVSHNNGGIPQPGHNSYMRLLFTTKPSRLERWSKRSLIPDEIANAMVKSVQKGTYIVNREDFTDVTYSDYVDVEKISCYYIVPLGILEEPLESNSKVMVQNLLTLWVEFAEPFTSDKIRPIDRDKIITSTLRLREAYRKWRGKDFIDYSEIILDNR